MNRLAVIAAVLAVSVGCSATPAGGSSTPQDRVAILEVIRGGMSARQNIFVPAPPVCPGPIDANVLDALTTRAPTRLALYFTSPELEKETEIAIKVIEGLKGATDFCVYGGGVDWVRLDTVTVNGRSASATGQFRAWSRIAQWQTNRPVMAEPHNTLDTSFKLRTVNGQWLISSYDWKFAPGSEP